MSAAPVSLCLSVGFATVDKNGTDVRWQSKTAPNLVEENTGLHREQFIRKKPELPGK